MRTGIVGSPAPPLAGIQWIDGNGEEREPLSLEELGDGFRILYFFQDWCEGCHVHGFPTLSRLVAELGSENVGFAAVQTVFEGAEVNTFERLRGNQLRYGLGIPFGHAAAPPGASNPRVMDAYRSGGTPWFVVIAPDGKVVFDGFELDPNALLRALRPQPA
jgi:thiol-disulfide isomerase/thioredoxin